MKITNHRRMLFIASVLNLAVVIYCYMMARNYFRLEQWFQFWAFVAMGLGNLIVFAKQRMLAIESKRLDLEIERHIAELDKAIADAEEHYRLRKDSDE
ncbi:hypothetical protein D3C75_581630 [compost metagenome]